MATISVIGGYGAVGTRLCRLLASAGHHVRIAGRNRDKAEALAEDIGSGAEARTVDATSAESLDRLLEGSDLVANCAGPYRVIRDIPARAALRHGIPYIDAAGDEFLMGLLEPLKDDFAASGRPCLLSCGTYPGLSSLFPRAMAERLFDSVDSFFLYTDFSRSSVSYTAAYDIVATLRQDSGAGMTYWCDGALVRDGSGMQEGRMPGTAEKRMMYPCFSEEMLRLVNDLGIREGHAFLVLDEETLGSLFAACDPALPDEKMGDVARQIVAAYSARTPETLFHLDMSGEKDCFPCDYSVTLHAPVGSLQFVSDVMAAAAEAAFEGQCTPGLHFLAGGCDADCVLRHLEKSILELKISTPE